MDNNNNTSNIEIYGDSGQQYDEHTLKLLEKNGEFEKREEFRIADGKYYMNCFDQRMNNGRYQEDKKQGADEGFNIIYHLKYKNARFKVVIKNIWKVLWVILGITIWGIIYYYVTSTENKLRTAMSEWGGGEQAPMDMVSTTETFSSDVLNDQRTMAINNIKQYLKEHPMDTNYKQLEKIVRTLCIESPDKRWKRIQYLQDYFPNLLGDTYVVGYSNLESQTTEQM